MLERGGICERCGQQPATDYHEICSRGRTRRGSEERMASYDKRICSILCRACHEKAHNPETQTALLRLNIERFSWDAVRQAFDAAGGDYLNIKFPERATDE